MNNKELVLSFFKNDLVLDEMEKRTDHLDHGQMVRPKGYEEALLKGQELFDELQENNINPFSEEYFPLKEEAKK